MRSGIGKAGGGGYAVYMKTVKTIPGRIYQVLTPQNCVVTKGDGTLIALSEMGTPACFTATGSEVELSDESAVLCPVSAPYRRCRISGAQMPHSPILDSKYEHCVNGQDMQAVQSDYVTDVAGGLWKYSLASLENGDGVFQSVVALREFLPPLPNLRSAHNMFYGCTLSVESVKRIAESVPETDGAVMTLGIDIRRMHAEPLKEALLQLERKGWLLEVQYNVPPGVPTLAELEYLESSGKQYIDTPIVPQMDTCLFMDVDILRVNSGMNTLFGVRNNSEGKTLFYDAYFSDEHNLGLRNYQKSVVVALPTERFTVEFTNSEILLNGESVLSFSLNSTKMETSQRLRLFAMNYNTQGVSQWSSIRLYAFRISSSESPLLDLIPVLDETGTACLFDRVSESYLRNSGSGSFKWSLKQSPLSLRRSAGRLPLQLPRSPVWAKVVNGRLFWCHYASDLSGWSAFASVQDAQNTLC